MQEHWEEKSLWSLLSPACGSWEGGQNPEAKVSCCIQRAQSTPWHVGEQILLQQKREGEG